MLLAFFVAGVVAVPAFADSAALQRAKANAAARVKGTADTESKVAELKAAKDNKGLRALADEKSVEKNYMVGVTVGAALFELGDVDHVVKNLLWRGNGPKGAGYQLLEKVGAKSIPDVVGYLKSDDMRWENAGLAMEKIAAYFEAQGAFPKNGPAFVKFAAPGNDWKVQYEAARALGLSREKSGEPNVRKLLKDKDAEMRRHAAWALGEIGVKASLQDLRSVASSDPIYKEYTDDRGRVSRDYWVREEAKKAIRKIESL